MRFFIVIKKKHLYPAFSSLALVLILILTNVIPVFSSNTIDDEIVKVVEGMFRARSQATLLEGF